MVKNYLIFLKLVIAIGFFSIGQKVYAQEIIEVIKPSKLGPKDRKGNQLIIHITKSGRVYLETADMAALDFMLERMANKYNIELTERMKINFLRSEVIGFPVNNMRQVLNLNPIEAKNRGLLVGIPLDSEENELLYWIGYAKLSNPNFGIIIKRDPNLLNNVYKEVIRMLKVSDRLDFTNSDEINNNRNSNDSNEASQDLNESDETLEPPKPNEEEEIFTAVEQQAEFPGGIASFARYLQRNLKYPAAAQRANVQGRVYVQFVINTDGSVQDVQVIKSVGFGCDEEAIRLIKSGPRWNPGRQSGRTVRSRFTQPITFQLSE